MNAQKFIENEPMITTMLANISPDYATKLLGSNTMNRPLTEKHAIKIAAAISRGEWVVNGDAIRISKSGRILDGQHRLTAIVISGISVQTLMVCGLDDSVFSTIDTGGKGRSNGDVLAINGEKNYNILAAAARMAYFYETNGNPFTTTSVAAPSVAQLLKFVEKNTVLRDIASKVSALRWTMKNLQASSAAFSYFAFSKKHPLECEVFFESLESGASLPADSPILHLRERLQDANTSNSKMTKEYKCALAFKAFKHHIDGASIKLLRVRYEGAAPEKNIFTI